MSAPRHALELSLLPERLAIIRFPASAQVPAWACYGDFFSITRTTDELSIVCTRQNMPEDLQCKTEWRAFKARGPFALSEIGILSALAAPLADANVSLFAISTFDTDYLLVNSEQLPQAVAALRGLGHRIRDEERGGE
jgi:uncharacterized protein